VDDEHVVWFEAETEIHSGGRYTDSMVNEIIKHYSNADITVVWQPALCIHSRICANGLPQVFDPSRRPWIMTDLSDTATITAQVGRCPSGALSWIRNEKP